MTKAAFFAGNERASNLMVALVLTQFLAKSILQKTAVLPQYFAPSEVSYLQQFFLQSSQMR